MYDALLLGSIYQIQLTHLTTICLVRTFLPLGEDDFTCDLPQEEGNINLKFGNCMVHGFGMENKIITVNSINQFFVFNFFFIYFLKKREGFGDMIFFFLHIFL